MIGHCITLRQRTYLRLEDIRAKLQLSALQYKMADDNTVKGPEHHFIVSAIRTRSLEQ